MKKPNILLVSIDTLRADHVSSYGYHRKTTPNLDRFAEEGARFNNAYSTAVWTPPHMHLCLRDFILPHIKRLITRV